MGIVVLPVMFYIPKFFEVRSHSVMWPHNERINCKNFVHIQLQLNEMQLESYQDPSNKSAYGLPSSTFNLLNIENVTKYHKDCATFNFRLLHRVFNIKFIVNISWFKSSLDGSDDFYRNVTINVQRWKVSPTELRKNQVCIYSLKYEDEERPSVLAFEPISFI
jgi:hypothetical protein